MKKKKLLMIHNVIIVIILITIQSQMHSHLLQSRTALSLIYCNSADPTPVTSNVTPGSGPPTGSFTVQKLDATTVNVYKGNNNDNTDNYV